MSTGTRSDLTYGFHNAFPDHTEYWPNLEALFHRTEIDKKGTLLKQGEMWNSVYYIQEGIARLFYTDSKGNEYNKDFFYEGNFFWPVAPSASTHPCLFSISALSEMVLWRAPFGQFKQKLKELNGWDSIALNLAERLAERKISREASFLLETPSERYIHLFEEYSELLNRIPDYHMASFLGITQVSLSRIKKKLLGV